jgi:hypothetical protein
MEDVVRAFIATTAFPRGDARQVMLVAALEMARRFDERPREGLSREIRQLQAAV